MSVHKTTDGRWRVAWRDANGGQRTRRFDLENDAETFNDELRRRKQLGPLAVEQLTSKQTLDDYIVTAWGPQHARKLAQRTQADYRRNYARWIMPTLGHVPINALSIPMLGRWYAAIEEQGATDHTLQRSHTVLSSIVRHAYRSGIIATNPMSAVTKAKLSGNDEIEIVSVLAIESIRDALGQPMPRTVKASGTGKRKRAAYTAPDRREPVSMVQDAALVGVLAYCGLRPSEALALRWKDVKSNHIAVLAALDIDGSRKPTKNRKRRPRVPAPSAVISELDALRRATDGRPDALVFGRADGRGRTQNDQQHWVQRRWRVACRRVGLSPVPRLYDLRHVCASLMIADGMSVHQVANQLGHSPSMTWDTYSHVLPETLAAGAARVAMDKRIAAARAT